MNWPCAFLNFHTILKNKVHKIWTGCIQIYNLYCTLCRGLIFSGHCVDCWVRHWELPLYIWQNLTCGDIKGLLGYTCWLCKIPYINIFYKNLTMVVVVLMSLTSWKHCCLCMVVLCYVAEYQFVSDCNVWTWSFIHCNFFSESLEKSAPNLGSCSFMKHGLVFIIFDTHSQHALQNGVLVCSLFYLICLWNAETKIT